jgi:hypothetical protein
VAEIPRSAGYEASIDSILRGLGILPTLYNPQRRELAYTAAADLNRKGLTDNTTVDTAATDAAGNITYRLVRGLDGTLYKQAFRQTEAAMNAAGTLESSFTEDRLRDSKRELDTARESAIQGFQAGQSSITNQQADEWRKNADSLNQTRGDYADWQSQQPVALPPEQVTPLAPPAASIGAPHAGSGVVSKPRLIKLRPNQADNPYERNNLVRSNPGYDLKKRGGNLGYVLRRR